jgi:hypothetical protein
VGNPPWDAVQMSEKEYFAERDPDIAGAENAHTRKELIASLSTTNPGLHSGFLREARRLEAMNHLAREGGRFPLTARGKINTYSLFTETATAVTQPSGRAGAIVPTGIATDATTQAYFRMLVETRRLVQLLDFRNAGFFPGVASAQGVRFCVLTIAGTAQTETATLVFRALTVSETQNPARRVALTHHELLLLNPNTGTCPVFLSRADADLTLAIYKRQPILDRSGVADGNTWRLSFSQGLFNMASDSGLFHTAEKLDRHRATFDGWAWTRGKCRWLPLYEAKMLSHYNHRHGDYALAQLTAGKEVRALPNPSPARLDDASYEVIGRYWVEEPKVSEALGQRWDRNWLLGWRDIATSLDMRTMVPCVLPLSAVGDKFLLAFPAEPTHAPMLQAVWSSLAFDYVARQKLSGTAMKYFIVKQVACPPPAVFEEVPPWAGTQLRDVVLPRVLELTYTSYRIAPYARDLGDNGAPFRWNPERRTAIRAELDAAMMHVYGLGRDEVEHVLDSFPVVRKYEERDHGEFRTKRLVLDCYDAMATAAATGTAWRTALDPPPGAGCRHENRGGS